ncbi:MAG: flagellar hook-associated protein 3 [Marinobacter sp. 34-60-7]|nr:MAG: flagellar hook-associated protein 3 [Marinobacter sp. 34-60-7]
MAAELKERLGQLANVANTRDASGEYIFSGFQGGIQAFAQDNTGAWQYQGDEGQRVLEIDDGVTVPISDPGKGIFVDVPAAISVKNLSSADGYVVGPTLINEDALRSAFGPGQGLDDLTVSVIDDGAGNPIIQVVDPRDPLTPLTTEPPSPPPGQEFEVAGIQMTFEDAVIGESFDLGINDKQSIFRTIENLIAGVDGLVKGAGAGNAEYDALIAQSLTNLDNAQESITLKQTELGGRMNAVESTTAFLEDSGLYTKEIRSQLQDVDYAEAISTLSFQSFVLQAAQQSFAQVSQLSLFDRL